MHHHHASSYGISVDLCRSTAIFGWVENIRLLYTELPLHSLEHLSLRHSAVGPFVGPELVDLVTSGQIRGSLGHINSVYIAILYFGHQRQSFSILCIVYIGCTQSKQHMSISQR